MNQAREWKSDNREAIADVCHRLYERDYLVATSGNVSVRINSGFLITPASTRKDSITSSSIVECNADGQSVDSEKNASSETSMHRKVYSDRSDVGAAIHAHPHYSLACQLAGISLTEMLLPELAIYIGPVPSVPYATPGTEEMAQVLKPFLPKHNAFLLQRHGVLVLGTDLEDAFNRLEHLEHVAHVAYLINSMDKIEPLTKIELEKLSGRAKKLGQNIENTLRGIIE